jgi:putative holliday junction resolvase
VVLWDERFSTTEAERVMLGRTPPAPSGASIDRVAAAVLLQGVLESRRRPV